MTAQFQADSLRPDIPLRNWDLPLRLYYDETNNIRRLTLSETGTNAPTDRTFALAGVALRPHQTIRGMGGLAASVENPVECPRGQIRAFRARCGRYEGALGSRKLSGLLAWLLDNEFLIHYSMMDVLYWSNPRHCQ